MLTVRIALRFTLVLVLLLVTVPRVEAGQPTEELRKHVDEVVKLLADPALQSKPEERRRAIRRVAEQIFDFGETARRALGAHWNARTPAERQDFVALFADLLERSYLSKIELYSGEKVTYTGDTVTGDQAIVKSRILAKQGSEVPIDYRMHRVDNRWLVYDVNIEGVSLVSNYRTQFNKIVQTEGYEALVLKLKAKDAEPAASPRRREPR